MPLWLRRPAGSHAPRQRQCVGKEPKLAVERSEACLLEGMTLARRAGDSGRSSAHAHDMSRLLRDADELLRLALLLDLLPELFKLLLLVRGLLLLLPDLFLLLARWAKGEMFSVCADKDGVGKKVKSQRSAAQKSRIQ